MTRVGEGLIETMRVRGGGGRGGLPFLEGPLGRRRAALGALGRPSPSVDLAEGGRGGAVPAQAGGAGRVVRGAVRIGSFRGRDVHLDARTAELSHGFWPD